MAESADDPECLAFLRIRLHRCHFSHKDCKVLQGTKLPSRLVDVGHEDEHIRLVETKGGKGEYAALSYCWGENSVQLKATGSMLDKMKNHIPPEQLPRTIQDTIKLTRMLGLKYIWVDCLCILQDSDSDWETEAAKMGQYYQYANLTIAASAAVSASCGLFGSRPKVSQPKQIQFRDSDGSLYPLVAQRRNIRLWTDTIDDLGPLSERGWTFQEHALSGRIIHFTEGEMIWECPSEMISEDGHPIRNNCHSMIKEFQIQRLESPESYWRFLVRAYSGRRLTYSKDKLPAIAGMADHYYKITNQQYLAGLWRKDLPVDLVWSSWGWEEADKPPKILPGPSWSWASINGGVAFIAESIGHDFPMEVHARVHNVHCSVPGSNPFGQVERGTLDITGPVLEMNLNYDGEKDEYGFPRFHLDFDGLTEFKFFPDTSLTGHDITDRYSGTNLTVHRSSTPPVPFQAGILCLWVLTMDETPPSELQFSFGVKPFHIHGIIVANTGLATDEYCRIGMVSTLDARATELATERRLTIIQQHIQTTN